MMRKINVLSDLPDDADPPSLTKFSLFPIMTIGANGKMDEVAFMI
jgi:HAE1 family hydrophobic/amphiphilic exporter-1